MGIQTLRHQARPVVLVPVWMGIRCPHCGGVMLDGDIDKLTSRFRQHLKGCKRRPRGGEECLT